MWFAKDADFDRRFREAFLDAHEAAARGDLDHWMTTAGGRVGAAVAAGSISPQRVSRHAADVCDRCGGAPDRGRGRSMPATTRRCRPTCGTFFYLPFGHSEDLADQERSVMLCRHLGPPNSEHSERHRDIVKRFGRFPAPQSNPWPKYDAGGTGISRSGRLCRIADSLNQIRIPETLSIRIFGDSISS